MTLTINIVYSKDKSGIYISYYDFTANPTATNTFIGKTDYDLYPHTIAETYHQQDIEVMAKGHAISYDITLPGQPNTKLTAIKQPLRNEKGEIIGIIANVNNLIDIEQQYTNDSLAIKKIAQETVGQGVPNNLSNIECVQYLRDYLENIIAVIPGHVYWQDRNNVFLGCNNLQAQSAHLASRKDIVGKTNHDMLWKAQADDLNKLNNRVMETGEAYTAEEYAVMADGPGIYLSQKVPLRDPQGKIVGIVGTSFNITDRKRAEEERLNLILKASNMGTWSWDFSDDSFVHDYVHHETPYRFTGSSKEAIARAHPADQEQLQNAMMKAYHEGIPIDMEYRLIWLNGQTRYIAMRGKIIENKEGKPSSMVGICWDITNRKELEKILQQQQFDLAQIARLNAMGELASTLAHELNQPLGSILNYTKGCIIRLKSNNYQINEIIGAMEHAANQATRAGEIIHRMKNFVRKGKLFYDTININNIIQETVAILRHEPSAGAVNIHLELAEQLPILKLDKIQIGQVVLNLLRNAIEALQQQTATVNPEITVKTSRQNNEVLVDVIDNGPGCPAELYHKLFTPYFTTKKTGMGMGLAICRTIIEAHQGNLTILPNTKPGAWFRFRLPAEVEASCALEKN